MGLLGWAFVFLMIYLIAVFFGFGHIAVIAASMAKILFFSFLAILIAFLFISFFGTVG